MSNVFSSDFLDYIDRLDYTPISAGDVVWAGPWVVEPRDSQWAVRRQSGGETEAVVQSREIALLLAAVFPLFERQPLYSVKPIEDARQGALMTHFSTRGLTKIGELNYSYDVDEPLSLLDYLLRTPDSLAFLLEAAPVETLRQAGDVLARRMAEGAGE